MRCRFLLLAFLVVLAGCSTRSLESGAQETFTREFSCPADRVTVTLRPEVDVYAKTFAFAPTKPPPDVAADKARLAVWNEERAKAQAFYRERYKAYSASGCGSKALYACNHPNGSRGGGENLNAVACSKLP
jgi:hypothetical protein